MQRIQLFDTSLRDGELSPRFRPSSAERLEIAEALDAAGIDVIELAYAEDGDERLAESKDIARRLGRATACILSPLTREGLQRARAFVDGIDKSRIHLYLDSQRIRAIESDPGLGEEIFDEMKTLIDEASEQVSEVEFSPQDATRTESRTLARVVAAGLEAGADIVSISDTVGTATPGQIEALFSNLRAAVPDLDSVVLSLHAHNHQGRAAQNAFAAIEAGVAQIEGTIGGVGPAGGNTDLLVLLQLARQNPDLRERIAHVDCDGLEALASRAPFRLSTDNPAGRATHS